MHIYCKKCKKHTSNTFPKKLILISKNKIKGKSKCAICLTYCVKYKNDIDNIDPKMFITKKNRLLMQSKCSNFKKVKICKRTRSKRFIE